MARVFEKDEAQELAIKEMVNSFVDAGLNGSGTGAGKSIVAIKTGIDREAKRVLIIGQPKVFENFAVTLDTLTDGEVRLRPCANAKFRDGTPAREAKANKEACMAGEDGWYFVSRELFQRESWRVREVRNRKTGKITKKSEYISTWDKKAPFDYVVYDESQMAAAPTSKSTKSVRKLKSEFKVMQSADWFGGEIANQYHVACTLWPEWMNREYPGGFREWRDENCTTKYDHFAFDKKAITGEIWPGFFAASLPLYVRIPSPVQKPTPEAHYIDLSPAERRLYDDLRKNLAAEIGGDLFVIPDHMQLFMRLREACLGVFRPVDIMRKKKVDGRTIEVPGQTIEYVPGDESSTVKEIREIIASHPGEPVIVLSGSKKWANKAAVDLGGLAYTGDQTGAQKAEAERSFMAGETKVLVGTEAMAEGLDGLQKVCRIAIIASRPGKGYMTPQFIGRIARRGQEREPQVYEIIRRDTIDVRIPRGKNRNGEVKYDPGVVERAIRKELMLHAAKSF